MIAPALIFLCRSEEDGVWLGYFPIISGDLSERQFIGPAEESCNSPCRSPRWSWRNYSRGKIWGSLIAWMEELPCFLMLSFCGFWGWSFSGCALNLRLRFCLKRQNWGNSLFRRPFLAVFGWLLWPIGASRRFLSFFIILSEPIASRGFFPRLWLESCSISWLLSSCWSWILC